MPVPCFGGHPRPGRSRRITPPVTYPILQPIRLDETTRQIVSWSLLYRLAFDLAISD